MKTKLLKERPQLKCTVCQKDLDWSAAYESSGTVICIECDLKEEEARIDLL